MTVAPDREPTLVDVINRLDKLSDSFDTLKEDVNTLKGDVNTLKGDVNTLKEDVNTLKEDVNTLKGFDERFTNYQQATQWVVQLAFTLIASATLTVIVTAILRR